MELVILTAVSVSFESGQDILFWGYVCQERIHGGQFYGRGKVNRSADMCYQLAQPTIMGEDQVSVRGHCTVLGSGNTQEPLQRWRRPRLFGLLLAPLEEKIIESLGVAQKRLPRSVEGPQLGLLVRV